MSSSRASSRVRAAASWRSGGDKRSTQGKADHHAYRDTGPGEHGNRGWHPEGVHHRTSEAVSNGFVAEVLDLLKGSVGLQKGMVDNAGQILPVCKGLGSKRDGIKCSMIKIKIFLLHGRNGRHVCVPRLSFAALRRRLFCVPGDEYSPFRSAYQERGR